MSIDSNQTIRSTSDILAALCERRREVVAEYRRTATHEVMESHRLLGEIAGLDHGIDLVNDLHAAMVKGLASTGSLMPPKSLSSSTPSSDASIKFYIDPGHASKETVQSVLEAMSNLVVAHGGEALVFTVDQSGHVSADT